MITMNVSKTMSKMTRLGAQYASGASVLLAACISTAAHAVNDLPGGPAVRQLNLHPAVTKIAEEQHWLHWFMMIICIVIFLAVFGVMFYSIWKHRQSKGAVAANWHENTMVEIVWTVIPFIIIILGSAAGSRSLANGWRRPARPCAGCSVSSARC